MVNGLRRPPQSRVDAARDRSSQHWLGRSTVSGREGVGNLRRRLERGRACTSGTGGDRAEATQVAEGKALCFGHARGARMLLTKARNAAESRCGASYTDFSTKDPDAFFESGEVDGILVVAAELRRRSEVA